MKKEKRSTAIQLLDLVYENANQATGHSWERINYAMCTALELAIGAGFEFAEGGMAHIFANYKSGYWLGETSEWIYSAAIRNGNMSAIKSFEAARKREPFIADYVTATGYRSNFVHCGGRWKRERLHVGATFPWKGATVTVTSFADDQQSLTACSYKEVASHPGSAYMKDKVDRRFKITRADILAERKARKVTRC